MIAGSNKFAFSNTLSHRIANLHSSYIERLANNLGIEFPKHWPQTLAKPTKPHFAELVLNAAIRKGNSTELANMLPDLERKTKTLEENRTKGRPIMKWQNIAESESHYTGPDNNSEVHSIIIEQIGTVDKPEPAKQSPKPIPTPATPHNAKPQTNPLERHPLYDAVRAVVVDVINTEEITAGVDEAQVNALIKVQIDKVISPTIVQVHNVQTNETTDLGLQHKEFPRLLQLTQVRGPDGFTYPIWLPGPAGSGKTTAAKNVAKALGIPFHHNGAIDTEYKLLGFTDAGGNFHGTPFYKAYKDGGVYLFDEVDASAPQALVALNAALENGSCVFGNGECVPRHKDSVIIAAANTYGTGATHEYVGRNKLDAATVDRFIMLSWEYDETLERAIARDDAWVSTVQKIRAVIKAMSIKHVVSPRASFRGADMLRAGMDRDYVMQAVIYKGMTPDQVNTVKSRAGVN